MTVSTSCSCCLMAHQMLRFFVEVGMKGVLRRYFPGASNFTKSEWSETMTVRFGMYQSVALLAAGSGAQYIQSERASLTRFPALPCTKSCLTGIGSEITICRRKLLEPPKRGLVLQLVMVGKAQNSPILLNALALLPHHAARPCSSPELASELSSGAGNERSYSDGSNRPKRTSSRSAA